STRPTDYGFMKTFDIKEVGLELSVTPHINMSGEIDIEVHQTINGIGFYDAKEGTARLTMREAQTNLTVSNGETIVLGGFIEEKSDVTEKRIPGLSNIPIIGKAFTNKAKTRGKSELMVFLTPKILDTTEDAQDATELKRRRLSEKKDVARYLKEMRKRHVGLMASESVIIDRRSSDWQYDFDRPEIDDIAWEYPVSVNPASFTLTKFGSCPFGFGSSHRLTPALVKTYLKPSEGVMLRKDFRVDQPDLFRTLTLKVASNDAAVVYLNGKMIDEDPLMKVRDGHDYDYWNRVRADIPASMLQPGMNTIMVLLGSDKTTNDGYFDLMLVGRR
ncbi:type II and III secretion system protein, partial [Candidatus Ozemobacteraceae bacterium]|nr:type II and III secretion system protein [Candidatus Ozemobacteraceae bacterium]